MDRTTEASSPAKKIPIKYGVEPNTIRFEGEDGVEHTIKLPQGPLPSAAPNNMEYEDDNGVKHSIYLPQGTMHTAWDHLENKRWDELAKFAPYTNQGYNDDDFKKSRELKEKRYEDRRSPDVDARPGAMKKDSS